MRAIRIHLQGRLEEGAERLLDDRAHHHLVRVLRRRVGERFIVFDGSGAEAQAEIIAMERGRNARVRIGKVQMRDRESPLKLVLVQALIKGDRMDWVVQKAVELGVTTIAPVLTEFSDVRLREDAAERKRRRWQEIAIGACEQCGRNRLPDVWLPRPIAELEIDCAYRFRLDLAAGRSLPEASSDLPRAGSIAIAVGPEGGFGDEDRRSLDALGFESVHLGPRTLRAETASIVALGLVQALAGDLGSANDWPEEAGLTPAD
ncbi:MAG: Lpg2936 family Dot/Icm T4SS effector methyltransferase [Wenzhouxiangellaceae bacterium]